MVMKCKLSFAEWVIQFKFWLAWILRFNQLGGAKVKTSPNICYLGNKFTTAPNYFSSKKLTYKSPSYASTTD